MKSRTSFFNPTVLKKDITRFAPLWGLYTIFLIILFLSGQREEPTLTANAVANMLQEMPPFMLIYAGLCANILFGDLFQSRMCNALHAMPLRRKNWFATHVLAGLLFCVVPSLVGAVLLMFMLQEFFYMALLWLAVTILLFLFFFALGVFSVMCAGNRLGMAAVYLIINLFSLLVYVLAKEVYEPLLYGIELVLEPFQFFCPVAELSSQDFLSFQFDRVDGTFVNCRIESFYTETWAYLFTVAAIGVMLLVLALLLYRRRKLECAGDFVAFRCLSPVFLVICTLGCGVFQYALSSAFGFAVDYVLMAIGVIVGFFAGKMLLERTVRVFHKKSFLGFAIFALALTASLVITKIDPLRITWYVPETHEIACMRVYRDNNRHSFSDMDVDSYQLDSPQEIETFRQIHAQLMAERGNKNDGVSQMYIHYKLENGREVIRYYTIDENTAAYEPLRMYFSDYRYHFRETDWNVIEEKITSIDVSFANYYEAEKYGAEGAVALESMTVTDPAMVRQFMEALRKDCDAGNLAQTYTFHVGEDTTAWCYLGSNVRDTKGDIIANGDLYLDLTIYPCAEHLNQVLEKWVATAATTE